MPKLNQIIAIEKGVKSRTYAGITALNKLVQKPDLFNGFVKNYAKKDEDGEDLPAERKRVQYNSVDVLRDVERQMSEIMQVTARKDWTNTAAFASVKIGTNVILKDVPITFLLFLEKALTDLRTFVGNLPTLDESETWIKDNNLGLFRSEMIKTHRTKKMQKPIVLYDATTEHPAQTQLITEDVIVGFWEQVKHSGAISQPRKKELVERIEKLYVAVKEAREEANLTDEVSAPNIGESIFAYLMDAPPAPEVRDTEVSA